MSRKQTLYRAEIVGLMLLSLGLASCGGVSEKDYTDAKKELAAQDQKIKALQQQLSASAGGIGAAAGSVPGLQGAQSPVGAQSAQTAQGAASAPGAPGVTTLIGAKVMPTPTVAPPPTPLPPGAPTAAPRVVPASYAEPAGPFTFYVETLATNSLGIDGWSSTVACTPNSVFKRGMKLVWRFEVFDMSTGKRLIGQDGEKVVVKLPHGEDITARFSQRGGGSAPDAPWMWSAAWNIPLEYPIGSLDYTIEVTSKDGRSSTFKTPAVVSSTTDSRVKII